MSSWKRRSEYLYSQLNQDFKKLSYDKLKVLSSREKCEFLKLETLEPFRETAKYLKSCFKTHKGHYSIKQDFLYPFLSIYKTITSVLESFIHIFSDPLLILIYSVMQLFSILLPSKEKGGNKEKQFKIERKNPVNHLILLTIHLLRLVKSVLLVVVIPIHLVIRIPLRLILTLCFGFQDWNNGAQVKRLVSQLNRLNNLNATEAEKKPVKQELQRKVIKALVQKRTLRSPKEDYALRFNPQLEDLTKAYKTHFSIREYLQANDKPFPKIEGAANKHISSLLLQCPENPTNKNQVRAPIEHLLHKTVITPQNLTDQLSKSYIGNDEAVRALSSAIYYSEMDTLDKTKTNLTNHAFIIGPTGSGKTYLVQEMAKKVNRPFIRVNCGSLTRPGIVGLKETDWARDLVEKHGEKQAQKAIVFFDEIDKIAPAPGVQSAMLTMLEPQATVTYQIGQSCDNKWGTLPTAEIIFVFGGTFSDIERIINNRIGDSKENPLEHLINEDLENCGMKRELLGRMGRAIVLKQMNADTLVNIMKAKGSVLSEYKNRFAKHNTAVTIDDETLMLIALRAMNSNTGARSLNVEIERLFNKVAYDIPTLFEKNQNDKHFLQIKKEHIEDPTSLSVQTRT